jgi:hypothetical protein
MYEVIILLIILLLGYHYYSYLLWNNKPSLAKMPDSSLEFKGGATLPINGPSFPTLDFIKDIKPTLVTVNIVEPCTMFIQSSVSYKNGVTSFDSTNFFIYTIKSTKILNFLLNDLKFSSGIKQLQRPCIGSCKSDKLIDFIDDDAANNVVSNTKLTFVPISAIIPSEFVGKTFETLILK